MRTVLRLIRQGVSDLTINPWAQILTLTAVTLVSFLVGIFLMAITTLDHQLHTVQGETVFQVYWRPDTEAGIVADQWKNIAAMPGFLSAQTFTPEQALQEMEKKLWSNAPARSYPFLKENNPLPPTAMLTFAGNPDTFNEWFTATEKYLSGLPGVERVSATPLRDELGQAWRKVNSFVMRPAILFLTLILGLVVGNTVRLSLLGKAQEVEILQLVGAFNWYIRLPLLIGGALQGLVGSALALVILRFIHLQIHDALNFPPLLMEIQFLSWNTIILMLAVPAIMGVVGGWVGMRR